MPPSAMILRLRREVGGVELIHRRCRPTTTATTAATATATATTAATVAAVTDANATAEIKNSRCPPLRPYKSETERAIFGQ